jgi:hypothetical protein
MTYRLSRTGRWYLLALMAATAMVWVFAGWLLADTLHLNVQQLISDLRGNPACVTLGEGQAVLNPGETACTAATPAVQTSGQLTTAFLLLTVLIGAPPLVWNMLNECAAAYTADQAGLHVRSLGQTMVYPWEQVQRLKISPERTDSPPRIDVILNESAPRPSRWQRWLHRAAAQRVPIYGNVANREALLATIKAFISDEGATKA